MAGSSTNQFTTNQNVKTIETDTMSLRGHLLMWDRVAIQISNISAVTISDIAPPATPLRALAKFYGLLLLFASPMLIILGYAVRNEEISYIGIALLLLALVLLVIGVGAGKPDGPKKALNMHMNSGDVYSILFKDENFMNEVLGVFAVTFESGGIGDNIQINISNSRLEHSQILGAARS